ncbi:MAG: alpha-L-fucosidase, partial [Alistipes sp.]|nr:alpha-L-fucosidase [Alistipes sp.]
LVGNNPHVEPHAGEDIQIFERDLPGENLAGLSGQRISRLPLETCQTMNGMWGYKLVDQNYKSVTTLIRYLVSTAGKGANLLLNIGPQANGELPQAALERLKGIGEWMAKNGDTIYGTEAGDIAPQEWGASTRKGDRLFIHIFELKRSELELELECEVLEARAYKDGKRIRFERVDGGVKLLFDEPIDSVDYIVELKTR